MTTTISGSAVTFSDGSTWAGGNGIVVPDQNTSRAATAYNIGYLAFANCIFFANSNYGNYGFNAGSLRAGLNINYITRFDGYQYYGVSVNTAYAADLRDFGSQSFYVILVNSQTGNCAGTWKYRGHGLSRGLNFNYGNFALVERVA